MAADAANRHLRHAAAWFSVRHFESHSGMGMSPWGSRCSAWRERGQRIARRKWPDGWPVDSGFSHSAESNVWLMLAVAVPICGAGRDCAFDERGREKRRRAQAEARMNLSTLQLSDLQLGDCSAWTAPSGTQYLELPHILPYFNQVGAGDVLDGEEIGTPAEYPFVCKAIGFTGLTPGTLIQIQWPDGRYLSNPGVDFFSFVRTGRLGRLIDPFKAMPANSKILMNINNSGQDVAANLEIYFEGCLRIPLVSQ